MPELLASPLTATPTARAAASIEFKPPIVYNWSLGVQRDLGWNLVGDVAYVGNAARNQRVDRPINGRPYGYAYQPSSLDPTNVIGGISAAAARRPAAAVPRLRQHHAARLRRLRRLPLDAVLGEPPPLADGLSFGVAYTRELVNKTLGAHRSVRRRQPRAQLHAGSPATTAAASTSS